MGVDPISLTLMGISLATTAAGGIMQAQGQNAEGQAKAGALNYQAQVAENNALIARQNQEWTAGSGEAELARQGLRNRATLGAVRAGQSASGVDVNSGSSADVQSAASELGMLDALSIRSDEARKIYGYQVEEQSQRSQAGLYRSQAQNAAAAGKTGEITSLLGTAGSITGKMAGFGSKFGTPGGGSGGGGSGGSGGSSFNPFNVTGSLY